MLTGITAGLISAALSIIGKLATQAFFEAVLKHIVIYGGDKLAAMTTNKLGKEIMDDVKKSLGVEP